MCWNSIFFYKIFSGFQSLNRFLLNKIVLVLCLKTECGASLKFCCWCLMSDVWAKTEINGASSTFCNINSLQSVLGCAVSFNMKSHIETAPTWLFMEWVQQRLNWWRIYYIRIIYRQWFLYQYYWPNNPNILVWYQSVI